MIPTKESVAARCLRCMLRPPFCICAEAPRVPARTEVFVVRHVIESHKPSNSARIAALALPRCTIVSYGARGEEFDEEVLRGEGTWLLYPDGREAVLAGPPPRRLVVLDGTWSQTKRMKIRIGALRGMPRLSLAAPDAPPRRLRCGRSPHEMATLEAIGRALMLLEGDSVGQPLLDLYQLFVDRTYQCSAGGRGRCRASARPARED